jgi:ATP-dependent DNA helicase RecQ
VVAYSETSLNRRKFLLHYFGEDFDDKNGEGANMCDNSKFPKEKFEGKQEVKMALETINSIEGKHKFNYFVDILTGNSTSKVKTYKHESNLFFGLGKNYDENFWNAVYRQIIVAGLAAKEIESYGTLFLTQKGKEFIDQPVSFLLSKEHDFSDTDDEDIIVDQKGGGGSLDPELFNLLKDLRKSLSVKNKIPPFVIFQDPSLEDMTIQYPITIEDLQNVSGVGKGKAIRYGAPFVELIAKYVRENNIERYDDFVIKSIANKSAGKVNLIKNIDKKIPLEEIAKSQGKDLESIINEIENIVNSGTKINIDYHLNDILDDDSQEEIYEYFLEDAETDDISEAHEEFDGDYSEDELRLMKIKFMSEMAN